MRRDSIFYQLFRRSPTLFFQLLPTPPEGVENYRFDSVAVKEPRFEIDGVFLPPKGSQGTVFICEVQFQRDERLYERICAETFPYFYRNRDQFSDWQVVVIYPSKKIEQGDTHPLRGILSSGQLHRVYLDELGDIRQLPPWLALMVLTTVEEAQAAIEARYLLRRTSEEVSPESRHAIIDMVVTIISYRFGQLSQKEVEKMLDITLQETRVYQEIKEEGREEGRREEAADLALRLLTKKFGSVDEATREVIKARSLPVLTGLVEATLDFSALVDLQAWLERN